jgi:hypothetical protein
MEPKEGMTIITYGQEVKIAKIDEGVITDKTIIYLEHPIVVPTREYTRDYISVDEIQKYVD